MGLTEQAIEASRRPTARAGRGGIAADGEPAAGAWLRLAALAGAATTGLVVISGAMHLGVPHTAAAVLAVPPLAAVVLAAAIAHRRLLVVSAAALGLFGLESAFGAFVARAGRPEWAVALHLAFGGLDLRRSAAQRGRCVPRRARGSRRLAGLPGPDQASDHDPAADHGGRRDVRRRGGSA